MEKKLGQHFLIDPEIIEKIADALNVGKKDVVIEVGPGKGALTEEVLRYRPQKYIGVEKDKKLAVLLEKRLKKTKKSLDTEIKVVNGDILKTLPDISSLFSSYKIAGNIPFYLTGYLLRLIGESERKPTLSVFLLQKEVAERLSAKPPDMNLLSASVQFWAKTEYLGAVPKKSFIPAPDVEGGIVVLRTKKTKKDGEKNYYKTVKIVFKHPRKTVLNNLMFDEKIKENGKKRLAGLIKEIGLNPRSRPEELSVSVIKKLAGFLWYNDSG